MKECKHQFEMHSWSTEDGKKNQPMYVKADKEHIYKLEECLQWDCQLRKDLLKTNHNG